MGKRHLPRAHDFRRPYLRVGGGLEIPSGGDPSKDERGLDLLYALGVRIRRTEAEAELSDIEAEIDRVLQAQRAKAAAGDENALDVTTLNVAAHRLQRPESTTVGSCCPRTDMSKRSVSQLTEPDGDHSRSSRITAEPKLSYLDLDQTLRPQPRFLQKSRHAKDQDGWG